MVAIAGCWMMDLMGSINCQLSALPNQVLATVEVLALTAAARQALLMRKLSVHIVSRVCIGPSGMFWVRQGK